ncbi:MAG: FAD/NAD(P)-binding protein, partial [Bacteroidota bacterium]
MLEWLIIGGGVHGTHLSHVLTSRAGWSRHKVRVLDPHAAPLARWQQMTENVGMAFMRSSFVHHIGLEPRGLERFAETPDGAAVARFAHPFRRPSYALFQRHAQAVADEHKLGDLRLQGRALGLTATKRGWRVETDAGPVDTKRVLLALGLSEQPCWPAWARQLRSAGANVHHLFEAGFRRTDLRDWTRAVVVGGGISAAQAALALAN